MRTSTSHLLGLPRSRPAPALLPGGAQRPSHGDEPLLPSHSSVTSLGHTLVESALTWPSLPSPHGASARYEPRISEPSQSFASLIGRPVLPSHYKEGKLRPCQVKGLYQVYIKTRGSGRPSALTEVAEQVASELESWPLACSSVSLPATTELTQGLPGPGAQLLSLSSLPH